MANVASAQGQTLELNSKKKDPARTRKIGNASLPY